MEPWDGPAAIVATDGRQIVATLDRNGLRPARYMVTSDDTIVLASEMGVLTLPEEKIVTKWRLQPGKMLLVDLEEGRLVPDEEVKTSLAKAHPYKEWLKRSQLVLEDLRPVEAREVRTDVSLLDRQQVFGYSQEDVKLLLPPMAITGQEAVGSMGTDTPVSVLSDKSKLLYTYFKQNFAQVTNPPIDPIREELVMSLFPSSARAPTSSIWKARPAASGSKCASPSSPMRIWRRSAPSASWRSGSTPARWTSPMPQRRAPPAWRTPSTACASARRRRSMAV